MPATFRSILLFGLAAVAQIGGAWLIWLRGPWQLLVWARAGDVGTSGRSVKHVRDCRNCRH